jgi:hypothetical protein
MRALVLVSCLLMTAGVASAQVWYESVDAGQLPATAQTPAGAGPLTSIVGNLGSADADMYLIDIIDPINFVAGTCNTGTTMDTQMWLFDTQGLGITHRDDGPCTGLQSDITGRVCPFPPGCYLVAVSGYNYDPSGPGGLIWLSSPFNTERCPGGPGAPGPVTSWGATGASGAYTIALVGVNYCATTAVEPSTWGQIKSIY